MKLETLLNIIAYRFMQTGIETISEEQAFKIFQKVFSIDLESAIKERKKPGRKPGRKPSKKTKGEKRGRKPKSDEA